MQFKGFDKRNKPQIELKEKYGESDKPQIFNVKKQAASLI